MRKGALALALLALAWGPAPAKVVKCSMSADGIVDIYLKDGKLEFYFPRVVVFDRNGGLVYAIQGYGPQTAAKISEATHKTAKKNAPRIEGFTPWLRDADGKPLDPAALKGKATIAQLGADWCKPCHALEADLRRLVGVNVLVIDADPQKHKDDLAEAMRKRLH
ncbi:MAG TPA: hypothetical protein VG323_20920 [Thermoanaerobaculia bacterium]|nr:hypothetical protein [Thermoanaerobaculia bacterium]